MQRTHTLHYFRATDRLSAMTRTQAPAAATPTAFLEGRATLDGTKRYRKRFARAHSDHFYRELAHGPLVSSVGLGTYLGECDDQEDARYTSTIGAALEKGVNLLDTAINYRCQRSERAVGAALREAVASGTVRREEVVVCTKGGYIPLEGAPPATKEGYREFLDTEYFERGVMKPEDVIAGGHCLSPRYLEDQLERSLRNLGLQCVDVFYVHNPETQLAEISASVFRERIRRAFTFLESAVAAGKIGAYGLATWNAFREDPKSSDYLSLEDMARIAAEAGGRDHHFRFVQLPLNLAMPEALTLANQQVGGRTMAMVQAGRALGITLVASAALLQGQLTRNLPPSMRQALGMKTDAALALQFVRSVPGVTTALAGMSQIGHVEANLTLVGVEPAARDEFLKLFELRT